MQDLKLGSLIISENAPAVIIAELSDGHMGSLEKAKELARAAKGAGADVLKVQMHFPDDEMVSGVKMWAGDLQNILKKTWFSPEKHKALKEYCEGIGIQYLCTPFSPCCLVTYIYNYFCLFSFLIPARHNIVCHLSRCRELNPRLLIDNQMFFH